MIDEKDKKFLKQAYTNISAYSCMKKNKDGTYPILSFTMSMIFYGVL